MRHPIEYADSFDQSISQGILEEGVICDQGLHLVHAQVLQRSRDMDARQLSCQVRSGRKNSPNIASFSSSDNILLSLEDRIRDRHQGQTV